MGAVGTRLGVMGGTFDPIHYGHLVTAEEALVQFGLDSVAVRADRPPWMKEHEVVSPAEDRYLMTVIATASNPLFRVSRMEVDRDGPTYTVDTLRALKQAYGPETDLFFITGADAIVEIFDVEGPRGAVRPRALHRGHAARLRRRRGSRRTSRPAGRRSRVMNIPALAISSTDIRARVARGPPDPLPRPRGREELRREGGDLPVSSGQPGPPRTRISRLRRREHERRRRGWELLVAVVVVVGGVAYATTRIGDTSADGGGPTPTPVHDEPSALLVLSFTGAPKPLLAVIGTAGDPPATMGIPQGLTLEVPGAGELSTRRVAALPGPGLQVALSNVVGAWAEHYGVTDLEHVAALFDRVGGLKVKLPDPVPVGERGARAGRGDDDRTAGRGVPRARRVRTRSRGGRSCSPGCWPRRRRSRPAT